MIRDWEQGRAESALTAAVDAARSAAYWAALLPSFREGALKIRALATELARIEVALTRVRNADADADAGAERKPGEVI